MAQQVRITLTDDVDGGEAAETVAFAIDGVAYEIDLSEANAAKFRAALHPFMGGGRRIKAVRGGKRPGSNGTNMEGGRSGEIRAWAKEHGIAVNDRGRIPASVVEQYQAAH
ncbi:histone-like nucleoid-structuring protein Lsr2 [Actinomadura fibrosa]|uniref:Lsr2 family protein n=1 Tax=Actinomadura fibrosa TaxID=111802 RepID=A0ABW2Y0F6_9ACTN|nr:Lsr2 family protein [Actinomadura fibrosa]